MFRQGVNKRKRPASRLDKDPPYCGLSLVRRPAQRLCMQPTPSDERGDESKPDGQTASPESQDGASALPPIVRVRTQATIRGRDAVVVRFGTGARLRYVDIGDAVREEWLPPDADEPARTVDRPDGDRAALALNAIGEYLTFEDRDRAAFVWGVRNVELVTG